jgi:hypothetical protein
MENLTNTETDRTLIINGSLNLRSNRIYWRDTFFKNLSNTVFFWGLFALGALILAYLTRDSMLGFSLLLFSLLIAAVPLLTSLHNYQSYMTANKKYLASLAENEKHYNLVIKSGAKGIEITHGENFSFVAWKTFRGALEKPDYFLLELWSSPMVVMKSGFQNESDLRLFRNILADRFGQKAILLK